MLDERQQGLNNVRNLLIANASVARERAKKGKENEGKVQALKQRLDELELQYADVRDCGNHLHDIYKNIEKYSQEHTKSAKDILMLAITAAGELVPDAGVNGIRLQPEANNRISIVNANGQNINLREGGGYRAVLGALLRYACIKAQPDALPFILFDEYFFTLSDTTTQAMKDVFTAMKKDITIVCIEQRRNAMDGILDREYTFKKDDNGTTAVTRTL